MSGAQVTEAHKAAALRLINKHEMPCWAEGSVEGYPICKMGGSCACKNDIARALADVEAAEREACAQLIALALEEGRMFGLVEAIRARGQS